MSDCFDHWADAYDRMLEGEVDDYPAGGDFGGSGETYRKPKLTKPKKALACKVCGQSGLIWDKLESGKWWVHEVTEDGEIVPHKCKQKPVYNDQIYDSECEEIIADIRNKLSPILFHLESSYDDKLPMELRLKNLEVAKKSFSYILDRLEDLY